MVELVTLEAAYRPWSSLKWSNERGFAVDIHHSLLLQLGGIFSVRQVHHHGAVSFVGIRFTEPLEFPDRDAVLISDLQVNIWFDCC